MSGSEEGSINPIDREEEKALQADIEKATNFLLDVMAAADRVCGAGADGAQGKDAARRQGRGVSSSRRKVSSGLLPPAGLTLYEQASEVHARLVLERCFGLHGPRRRL